jgi:hypothetical protein
MKKEDPIIFAREIGLIKKDSNACALPEGADMAEHLDMLAKKLVDAMLADIEPRVGAAIEHSASAGYGACANQTREAMESLLTDGQDRILVTKTQILAMLADLS